MPVSVAPAAVDYWTVAVVEGVVCLWFVAPTALVTTGSGTAPGPMRLAGPSLVRLSVRV